MLKTAKKKRLKVSYGQTIKSIAEAYHVSEYALVKANGLKEEVMAGQILILPCELSGNAYTARTGDTKSLLCGSRERYEEKNGKYLYLGARVIL